MVIFDHCQAPDSALHPTVGQGQRPPAEGPQQLLPGGCHGPETVEAAERAAPA